MNRLLLVLLVVLLNVLVVSALNDLNGRTNWDKCALELQSIVKNSQNCAQKYLERLNKELKKKTPLLFSPQADSVIQNFEQTYGVQIAVNSPFMQAQNEFGETCFTFQNQNASQTLTTGSGRFPFETVGDYSISRVSVKVDTNTIDMTSKAYYLLYSYDVTPGYFTSLVPTNYCAGNRGLN